MDAAEDGHDQHLGRLRPVAEVREHATIEDAEQAAGKPGEAAGQREHDQLVETHVDADELCALGIVADGGEDAAERRAHDAAHGGDGQGGQDQRQVEELVVDPEATDPRDPLQPCHAGHGHVGIALLAARHVVPLEADRPHDLGERHGEHRKVDGGEAHAEEAEDRREQCATDAAEQPAARNGTPRSFMKIAQTYAPTPK